MFDNLRHTLDLDDLLFEKRNKDYGAYQLRRKYNNVVVGGILIASLLVSTVVILPFVLTPRSDNVLRGGLSYVQVQMDNLEAPPEEIYVPPPPPPPEGAPVQDIQKYVPPEVVDSIMPLETTPESTDQYLSQTEGDQIVAGGDGIGENLLTGEEGVDSSEPYYQVELMPSFKGGDVNKFREWVQKRTNYPQAAYDNKIRGTVFLTFIVEKDGSVSNVTVLKGVDPLLDEASIKSISESPKWTPGLQRGQPVRVRFQIALNFMF
jgi:protein TonB